MRLIVRIGFLVVATILVAARVFAQSAASPVPSAAATPAAVVELKPGTVIAADNVEQFSRYVPAAASFAVAHGFKMRVLPERRVEWSQGFQHATEKYAATPAAMPPTIACSKTTCASGAKSFGISSTAAARMTGVASKNEKRAACS